MDYYGIRARGEQISGSKKGGRRKIRDIEEIKCKTFIRICTGEKTPRVTYGILFPRLRGIPTPEEEEYEFYNVHYESPLGTPVIEVLPKDIFFVVGIYRNKTTREGINDVVILAYQTDAAGEPVIPYIYDKDTTSTRDGVIGKFEIGAFVAPDGDSVFSRTFDKEQAEDSGLPT